MAMLVIFEEQVIKCDLCIWSPVGKIRLRARLIFNKLASELNLQNPGKIISGLGNFNAHVRRRIDGFESVHGGCKIIERNVEGRRLLEFCREKKLCGANTWFEKKERSKIPDSMGGNETEIDFTL